MITEDYVSFETAKLLKEKGFDEECSYWYYDDANEPYRLCDTWRKDSWLEVSNGYISFIHAPTLQMAMKWLREVHRLSIVSFFDYRSGDESWWSVHVDKIKDGFIDTLTGYCSYEEACEAAIKYCLTNLIKNEDEEEESDIPVPKTVDEAISTLVKILSDEDMEYLLKNGAISMHDSLGKWIRNEWGLWTGSELKDELMNMNKGLNHPDDMSNYIIEEFIKYWNNKL